MRDVSEITPGLDNAGQQEEEHLKRLPEAGYKMVVDLRTPGETPRSDVWGMVVWRARMEYVNIPVGHKDIDNENFGRFRELIRDGGRRPLLAHCSSANRVGALLIPYLILDERMTPEKASEIAAEVGLRSNRLKRAALRYVGAK